MNLCVQLTDLVFIHDNISDEPKLLEIFSYVSLRDVRLNAANKHTVLLLALPGVPHSGQCLVFSPFDVLIQAWHYKKHMKTSCSF